MILEDNSSTQPLNNEMDSSSESIISRTQNQPARITDLPEYDELILSFHNGNWYKCNVLIETLLKSFPDDPEILRFKADVETKAHLNKLRLEEEKKIKGKFQLRILPGLRWNWILDILCPGFKNQGN